MKAAAEAVTLIAGMGSDNDNKASTRILFHLSNSGDSEVRFLIWNTPFERVLSADVFTVTKDGVPMKYQGRVLKRSEPDVQDFMTIQARDRLEVIVDIAAYYDMPTAGEYLVTFTPSLLGSQPHLNWQTPVQIEEGTLMIQSALP